jgi:flagellar L-ring protein FlgH
MVRAASVLLALMTVVLASGCSSVMKARPEAAKLPDPVKVAIPAPVVKDGSLWQDDLRGDASLFSDQKARTKGDIVTILVVEKVDAKRARNTDTSREMTVGADVKDLFYPALGKIDGNPAKVDVSTSRNSKGGGSISDTGEVRATVAAQVVDVLPNGNLVLMATKEVTVSGEVQTVTLTGIARQKDISSNNQISSANLAEARVHIAGNGPLNDAQRRTLVTRLLDWVNLF